MLYVDTFGAFGGVGRCTIELLPFLAPRMGKVVLAGQSHIVNSFGNSLPASAILELRNLERPAYLPSALILRALASMCPDSPKFTDALLGRAGVLTHNKEPVLINYPQALPPPRLDYEFDILLHDLNWRRYPENSAEPEELDRRCQEWVRRAGRIFTNSDFTRHEVIELYGTEPSRVLAAPLAAPSLPPAEDLNDDPQKLRAFGVKLDGYFFYPSVNGVHKGHDVLADALEMAGPRRFAGGDHGSDSRGGAQPLDARWEISRDGRAQVGGLAPRGTIDFPPTSPLGSSADARRFLPRLCAAEPLRRLWLSPG